MLRLPYFDPVRFVTVDLMYCLFLGIVKWIVKRIWVDEEILTTNTLKMVQKKMDEFQIPSDLGRIPEKFMPERDFPTLQLISGEYSLLSMPLYHFENTFQK